MGGNLMSTGDFLERLSQQILVGIILVGRLGVKTRATKSAGRRRSERLRHSGAERFRHGALRKVTSDLLRPISGLRFWISEGLTQTRLTLGWNSHVHRGFPGILSQQILVGRILVGRLILLLLLLLLLLLILLLLLQIIMIIIIIMISI